MDTYTRQSYVQGYSQRKNNGSRFHIKENSLLGNPQQSSLHQKKHALGIFLNIKIKASFIVETALAFPFFLCLISILIFLLLQLDTQREIKIQMMKSVRNATYFWETKEVNTGIMIGKTYLEASKRKITSLEVQLLGEEETVGLFLSYQMKFPYRLFTTQMDVFSQQYSLRKWMGETAESDTSSENQEVVYITKESDVYHESRSCTHLKPSIQWVSMDQIPKLRNAGGEKYRPCEYCGKSIKAGEQCVITQEGNRYHSNANCSRLKRTIFEILRSEIGNRRPCSKCGKENIS